MKDKEKYSSDLISIIMPCYNAGLFIAETIQTVLNQTYENWELIIVDDGSTDESKIVIDPFLSDNRIKYIYQENGRQGKARNNAIENSNGDFIAFLDADDLWDSCKLEKQLLVIKEKNVDLVFSSGYTFSNTIEKSNLKDLERLNGEFSGNEMLNHLLVKNQVPILSVLVKANAVSSVGNFSTLLKVQNAEDYQLWLKLADAGFTFYGMEDRLFYYRVHETQITSGDSLASVQALNCINEINFSSIGKKEKFVKMNIMANKFVLAQADRDFNEKYENLILFFKTPLNKPFKYAALKVLKYCGKRIFLKIGYRYLTLNNQN